jgi:hypothetical protein
MAGLFGFLVHTMIDLGLFVPAPASKFLVLLATAMALPEQPAPTHVLLPRRTRPALFALAGGAATCALIIFYLAVPAAVAARHLHLARIAPPADPADMEGSPRMIAYRAAVAAYPLDGTALDELIEERAEQVRNENEADRIMARIQRLKSVDPCNSTVMQSEALVAFRLYLLKHDRNDLDRAVEAQRDFVALAPASPYRWITLADLLQQAYTYTRDTRYMQEQSEALARALNLDERRVYVSPPNRFSQSLRAQLQSRLEKLKGNRN